MNYQALMKIYHEWRQLNYNNFNKLTQNNSLINVGYIGNSFSWYNEKKNENATFARLYRVLPNYLWLNLY